MCPITEALSALKLHFVSETNTWTKVTLPQLSVPRAGHSIITMETAARRRFSYEGEDVDMEAGPLSRNLLVFGGGDNEGNFYCDLTTVAVEELLGAVWRERVGWLDVKLFQQPPLLFIFQRVCLLFFSFTKRGGFVWFLNSKMCIYCECILAFSIILRLFEQTLENS